LHNPTSEVEAAYGIDLKPSELKKGDRFVGRIVPEIKPLYGRIYSLNHRIEKVDRAHEIWLSKKRNKVNGRSRRTNNSGIP